MSSMQQNKIGPQTNSFPDEFEPGDTNWATYMPPSDSWDLGAGLNLIDITRQARQVLAVEVQEPELTEETPLHDAGAGFFWDTPRRKRKQPARLARRVTTLPAIKPAPLEWPPGAAGQLARYIYDAAPRPVREVAIVGAIGLLAGICGRQWHIPKSGLNVYLVLVARSAIGKEAMHDGISEILDACQRKNPHIGARVDFTEFASGPALIKGCSTNPCFVNVSGELGQKFKRLAQSGSMDGPLQTWRTQITHLYSKSAPTSIMGGISYSSIDNNVASIKGVSYSLIGETTPGTFLESLNEGMMEDGFMSRFTTVEYDGERPEKNLSPLREPPEELVIEILNLMQQADDLMLKELHQRVERTPAATVELELFEKDVCDLRIEASGTNESRRQMWNRAGLKALRIAGLLAVADNFTNPIITLTHAQWAINLVLRDIVAFTKRLEGGDVGSGDDARERKLAGQLKQYLLNEVPASYNVPDEMRQNGIVPRSYMQIRTAKTAAFYNHKLGTVRALDETIAAMVANGYLMEVQKDKVIDAYSYHGKAYRVLRLPDYDHT